MKTKVLFLPTFLILTLKCIRGGGPLEPMILFSASPVKTRRDFCPLCFGNCLTVGYASFGEKKIISAAPSL